MTTPDSHVSRRALLVLFGVAAVAAGATATLGLGEEPRSAAGKTSTHGHAALQPLANGSPFARWTVGEIGPLHLGAVRVVVVGEAGERFALEVMARDLAEGAPRAPGESKLFAVYLANNGDGDLGTLESHGLAAMTLASIIERHETPEATAGFLTLSQRLAKHVDQLGAPGSTAT